MRLKAAATISIFLLLLCHSVADAEPGRKEAFIRMEEVEIIGIVEHPEITYIIPKTKIRFKHLSLDRSFNDEALRIIDPLDYEELIEIHNLTGANPGLWEEPDD